MPEYYAMGYANRANPKNISSCNPDSKLAKIIAARLKSSPLYEKPDAITRYIAGIGGIPEGAFILLLEYSLGSHYPIREYKLEKYLPRKKALIFDGAKGASMLLDIGVSKPEDLEGKVISALFQNEAMVGIKTPAGAK